MTQSDPIKEFRIAPEWRRCCYYGLIAVPVGIGLAYFQVALGRAIDGFLVMCVVFSGVAVAIVIPLRWKLRLDAQGLKRGRLFRRDSWTWDDFASGRLQKLYPQTLLDPDRPWWRRKLNLGFMSRDDIQIVFEAINAYYRLPEAPEVPDMLKIKYRFRRRATFDRDGIHLRFKGLEKAYSWLDVQNVSIVRMDTLRRDFSCLQIVLPDEEIKLERVSETNLSWRGATSEVINEFLYQHVWTEKINVAIAGQEIPNREQIERKLAELKKANRQMLIWITPQLIVIVGWLVWIGITEGFADALVVGAILSLCMSIFVGYYVLGRAQIKKLMGQLNSVTNGDGHSADKSAS
jgi:hypothetical protein